MNRDNQASWHSSLLIRSEGEIALARSTIEFATLTIWFFFLLIILSAGQAFGQSVFESHLADAVSAQSAGNIPGAISAYQSALAIRPDIPEVWANLGLMQHQEADFVGALHSFETANHLQPKLFVPLLFLGIENLQLGNKTNALRYLSMARQLHPNDFEIYMNLGRAHFELKQFENASIAYGRATELQARSGEAWYRLGITYLEMSEAASGDFFRLNRKSPFFKKLNAESLADQDKLNEAADIFRELLSSSIVPPCTRSSFALVLLRQRKFSDAQAELQQDMLTGKCSLARVGLIHIAIENNDTEETVKSVASLWALDPGFFRAHISELIRGMTPEQIRTFNRALTQSDRADVPPDAIAVLRESLGGGRSLSTSVNSHDELESAGPAPSLHLQDLFTQGEYGKCRRILLARVSSLSNQNLSLLATCSFWTGDFKTTLVAAKKLRAFHQSEEEGLYWSILAEQRLALSALAYAGEVEPNSIRLHELLAESYRDRERYDDAEAEYTVALNINPNEFSALAGAATNYLQELRIDRAHKMIQDALAQKPSDPEANYIMGEVLFAEHKYSEAEPYLVVGLKANKELVPRVHALLGQIYGNKGETSRAIEEYKLGLPSDDDGSVHFQLGRLYQKAGEAKLAADAFEDSKTINARKQTAARRTFSHQSNDRSTQP